MRNTLFFIYLIISLGNCMAQFSKEEIDLIRSGSSITPFSVLKITEQEDSLFLRKQAQNISVKTNDEDLKLLIERLKRTMAVEHGVGIAAPQIGISRNLFLFTRVSDPDHPIIVAINPKITIRPKETVCFERDGCLSIPGISGNSIRYPWVDVEYTNEKGEFIKERLEGYSRTSDFTGVIFQHEYDHLQGILFIDKLCRD